MKIKNLTLLLLGLFAVPIAWADDLFVLYSVPSSQIFGAPPFAISPVAMYPQPHNCGGDSAIYVNGSASVPATTIVSPGVNGAASLTWYFQNYALVGYCLGVTPEQIVSATLSSVSPQGVASYNGLPFSMAINMQAVSGQVSVNNTPFNLIRCGFFAQTYFGCCYSTDPNGCTSTKLK